MSVASTIAMTMARTSARCSAPQPIKMSNSRFCKHEHHKHKKHQQQQQQQQQRNSNSSSSSSRNTTRLASESERCAHAAVLVDVDVAADLHEGKGVADVHVFEHAAVVVAHRRLALRRHVEAVVGACTTA